jgi:hypothetical protein
MRRQLRLASRGAKRLLVLTSALALAWPASAGEIEIPFERIRQPNAILVHAIANEKPVLLILDTGAGTTVLSLEVLGRTTHGLKPSQFAPRGAGMSGEARLVAADLQLGSRAWRGRPVVAMNLEEVSRVYGRKIDGILGQDILSEFERVSIDFRTRKLTLSY